MTQAGVRPSGSILDRIIADKREQLEQKKRDQPEATLLRHLGELDEQWRLSQAIIEGPRGPSNGGRFMRLIAEIKKASPSKGRLISRLDHLALARTYTLGGAAGISVVTEPNYFQGDLRWLTETRISLKGYYPGGRPSMLRKDFLVDPYEITESRAAGADALLLIVAVLDTSLLRDLIQKTEELQMEALVEVHSEAEAERAVAAGASMFGINNRDLHTFEVDLSTTERLRPLLPRDAVVVAESGVQTRADVERLYRAGANAVLVGEAFMTSTDVRAKMQELRF
ncbi:MAG TPA: indole-3-glycerol phosphate synthase TrpC [Dehalococcoidia bacterium]|nr:indole-3-glycerol phosphate synthase TrpC [Dehalococcoidia bacterium]